MVKVCVGVKGQSFSWQGCRGNSAEREGLRSGRDGINARNQPIVVIEGKQAAATAGGGPLGVGPRPACSALQYPHHCIISLAFNELVRTSGFVQQGRSRQALADLLQLAVITEMAFWQGHSVSGQEWVEVTMG
ncbi:hypothetical protein MUK42_33618 [Musa troglodytarum]|uniref:Uncharacterized protein n=1 Tax=Musa troglodytarum TaxID=320322 RepID=A0A9E7KIA2_9LILI|nr:hypothetical protein MUK42_33618 [Musa troglodytarum]